MAHCWAEVPAHCRPLGVKPAPSSAVDIGSCRLVHRALEGAQHLCSVPLITEIMPFSLGRRMRARKKSRCLLANLCNTRNSRLMSPGRSASVCIMCYPFLSASLSPYPQFRVTLCHCLPCVVGPKCTWHAHGIQQVGALF